MYEVVIHSGNINDLKIPLGFKNYIQRRHDLLLHIGVGGYNFCTLTYKGGKYTLRVSISGKKFVPIGYNCTHSQCCGIGAEYVEAVVSHPLCDEMKTLGFDIVFLGPTRVEFEREFYNIPS